MRTGFALPVIGTITMLTALAVTRAADNDSPRALVDRAVKAHGGQALLERYPAVTIKLKGTFHGLGEAAPFTGESAADGPERQKLVIETKVEGEQARFVTVVNRDNAWAKINDDTQDLEDDELAEARHGAYTDWVSTLAPLKDKTFRLALLGEVKIDARPAVGIRVSKEGRRDVKLYFDKTTGLLVKTETRVKDDNGRQVTEEAFWSNYKEIQGTKQAMRFTIKRAGRLYMEVEAGEYRLTERLDEGVFAKP